MVVKNQVLDQGTMLEPEALVEQIDVIRSLIEEVTPLTPEQKRTLRNRMRRQSDAVLASSINMIGALDNVALALGQKPEDVRKLQVDWNRWTAVADALRALLNGVEGANLIRRERLALLSTQAVSIGKQLARDPAHAALVPHVQEVKRLRKFQNRRKAVEDAQPPVTTPKA